MNIKSITKKFINQMCPHKYSSIQITDDISIIDLKKIIIRRFFQRKNQKLISDLKLMETTNFFETKYDTQNAYIYFSKESNEKIYYKDIRSNIKIDIYGPVSKREVLFPLSIENNIEMVKEFLVEEMKTDKNCINIYRNNSNRDSILQTEEIKKYQDEGLIALLFPICANFVYRNIKHKLFFKFNESVITIKKKVAESFSINNDIIYLQFNDKILNGTTMIHDVLRKTNTKPTITVIKTSEINVHVPFGESFYEILFPISPGETYEQLISKIQKYFSTDNKLNISIGNYSFFLDPNELCSNIFKSDFQYVTVKSDEPLKINRFIKIKKMYMKVEIMPNETINEIIQGIAVEMNCDPKNIKLTVDQSNGNKLKLEEIMRFTDYYILPNDEMIATIDEIDSIKNEKEKNAKLIEKMKEKIAQKDKIISENLIEINHLKERCQQFDILKSLKKTKKDIKYFNIDDYDREQSALIGYGGFSNVYRVSKKQMFAKKELNEIGSEKNGMKRFISESKILFQLRHPCIIRIYGFNKGDDNNYPSMILRLEPKSLQNAIENCLLSQMERCRIAVEIVLGMRYIHSKNVIHRDLKPNNILLSRNNHVRISDFGLSIIDDPGINKTNSSGSFLFMAPELLSIEDDENETIEYNNKIDVFAFSIVLFFIVVGKFPPININRVIAGLSLNVPSTMAKWVKEVIDWCQSHEPEKRPTFNEIFEKMKQHNFDLFSDNANPSIDISTINERISKIEAFEFINDH